MEKLRLKFLLVCALVLLVSAAPVALGDWDPGDGHKMHYPQLPKEDGWDVAFQFGRLADDWQCSQTGPVEDIHFWVSWEMDMVGPINGFSARIWSDDPCGPNDYSEPNELLWERDFDIDDFTVRDMPDGLQQGWFDPFTGFWVYPDHVILQQINIEDINDPFIQKEGEIYWLEIDMWGAVSCGWKESVSPQFRDDAVFWDSPDWIELIDPEIYESMDLAFVITGGEEEEVVKWEQPPCLDGPNCMDVDATDDDWWWWAPQALADDFLCTTTGLITDIHIWGSWLYDELPDYDPNHVWFTLCLYSNDPCGPMGWSEPAELLWTKEFHEGQFDVEIFAEGPEAYYIPCEPFYMPDSDWTCWLYSFYIDPCEAFVQEEGTIYWLALQAHIYDPDPAWEYRFGWKNSSEQWNDDAVWSVGELPDNLGGWNELRHPLTEESVDLAFKITTEAEPCEPNEPMIKWEQPPCLGDPNLCMDVDATDDDWMWWAPQALADDFLCNATGLITDIHIWGSWLYDEPPYYDPNHVWFTLCIYSNDPCGPMGWSEPAELLWTKEFHEGQFDVEIFAEGPEAYYIPCEPEYFPDSDWTCWLYSFYIDPCEAFVQEKGTIYWLALQAHIYDPDTMPWEVRFGWKNSSEQWNDDAVWAQGILPGGLGAWNELRHPLTEESVDLAFKITTEAEEPNIPEPKEPVPHLKWSQPPIEIDPDIYKTPTYCGWNEPSHSEIISFTCWGPTWPYQCHGDADNAVEGKMAYRVYINDLAILSLAMGGSYPNPPYNPCADFDRDLVVGPSDLNILQQWWGVPFVPGDCPPWTAGTPATGQTDYWDLFAVSLSPNDVYWNLVDGGAGVLSDPLVSPDPDGSSVIDTATPLGGVAWGFGGSAWGDGILDSDVGAYSIQLMGEPNYFLSVVLDTSTSPQRDETFPSWGTISNIVVTPWNAGAWGAPIQPNWVISSFDPDSGTAVTPSSVTLASNDFGANEMLSSQPIGIWGAAAELPPADGYKVDFEPNVSTWDSYDGVGPELPQISWYMVADDFRCLGPMPITSIHWWGSYLGWEDSEPPEIEPEAWRIGFWSNVPAGLNAEYSYPEKLLWQIEVRAPRVEAQHVGQDYFPDMPPESCFQYYVELLPEEYFWQDEFDADTNDHTFWLSIAAVYPIGSPADFPWGWKTRPWSWMDDAVRFWLNEAPEPGMVLDPSLIEPIEEPIYGESYDMAFELDTDPNYIKWEQAYDSIRHWAHYEDELSMAREDIGPEPNIIRLVADDWRCDQNTPVTAAVWWGSYIDYQYEACQEQQMVPPVKPNYFWLTIWDDVPAGYAKWTQLPDLTDINGIDVDAVHWDPDPWKMQVLADDFECITTGPITDIYIWGSWLDDELPPGGPNDVEFWVEIFSDNPVGPNGWSVPDDMLWWWDFWPGEFDVWPYAEDLQEGYYSPCTGFYQPIGDTTCWLYHFHIDPCDAFIQQGDPCDPNVYWLVVQALPQGPERFGWKTSTDHHRDDAVWKEGWSGTVGPWNELRYPIGHPFEGNSIDLAFEINPGEGPSYSHPNDIIWEYKAYDYDEVLVGYDKHPEDPTGQGREPVFRYSVRLPDPNWFCQDANDGIYWFSVVAVYDENVPNYDWGWTNHEHVYNDDAVAGYVDANGAWVWEELYDQNDASEDMSFVLFTACFPCTHPDYFEWLYVGKPNCWCYPRQCHGDADGLPSGKKNYWVATPDLTIMKSAWGKPLGLLVGNEICADFDHLPSGKKLYRVATPDLIIMKANWGISNGPDPNCFTGY